MPSEEIAQLKDERDQSERDRENMKGFPKSHPLTVHRAVDDGNQEVTSNHAQHSRAVHDEPRSLLSPHSHSKQSHHPDQGEEDRPNEPQKDGR